MSDTNYIVIVTKDCTPFNLKPGEDQVIQHFVRSFSKTNTFLFSTNYVDDENLPVAEFNYSTGQWWAGRLVGEAVFSYQDKTYKITIKPRFGELFLFRMLEEIFNIKLAETTNTIKKDNDFQFLIKKLISFLWLNMLAKANKHGLPRNSVTKTHRGQTVRGRINVSKTIRPYHTTAEIVSNYREKESNEIISQILYQAYTILVKNYLLGTFNLPNNAKDAIIQLETSRNHTRRITQHEYAGIKYKDIYQSYKTIVDFSWDIIQRKSLNNNLQSEDTKQGYCFFIDIAEIWELYLKSLLKRYLQPKGWNLRNDKLLAYHGKLFQRHLIPDIVFQKENDIVVFDAKYKRNYFAGNDIDRADFFQIHTYINYLQQNKNVIMGGLLYPLSIEHSTERQQRSASKLFGNNLSDTTFIADGIDISFLMESEGAIETKKQFAEKEDYFLNRLYVQITERI